MFLDYDMPLWRPPSEGPNLIIQATLGCSFNRCSFCSMYRSKDYSERPLSEVEKDIAKAAVLHPDADRIFLADGDAIGLPTDHLLALLERLHEVFPDLTRVSSYALPMNLLKKSPDELERLRDAGLTLLYYGIESGSADILKRITKGATPDMMAEGLQKARAARMKVSATVILGAGGKNHWRDHIEGTADLVNRVELNYLSTLQLGLDPTIKDEFLRKFGEPFEPQTDKGMLEELEHLVTAVSPKRPVIFRSNHASNALPLAGRLPKDGARLAAEIRAAREGRRPTVPRHLRGY